MSLFADVLNVKALAALAGLAGAVMGLMMYWLKKRYGGDPEGRRAEARRPRTWRGKPLSPAEWEALRQKGMSEEQIAEVDKAARWAGRSAGSDPPAA